MKINLGPSKLIWHHTNKQMAFEFLADWVVLKHHTEMHRLRLDPLLLQRVLGRAPKPEEEELVVEQTIGARLECSFQNPAYGEQVAERFLKRFTKSAKAQQVLLVPNYGNATKKESMIFWRTYPYKVSKQEIVFYVLTTDDTGERVRRGL